ncbi:MAG: hypothetical protein ACUVQZ_10085 [Candidatus Caldatribacteriaceae bacterium]
MSFYSGTTISTRFSKPRKVMTREDAKLSTKSQNIIYSDVYWVPLDCAKLQIIFCKNSKGFYLKQSGLGTSQKISSPNKQFLGVHQEEDPNPFLMPENLNIVKEDRHGPQGDSSGYQKAAKYSQV